VKLCNQMKSLWSIQLSAVRRLVLLLLVAKNIDFVIIHVIMIRTLVFCSPFQYWFLASIYITRLYGQPYFWLATLNRPKCNIVQILHLFLTYNDSVVFPEDSHPVQVTVRCRHWETKSNDWFFPQNNLWHGIRVAPGLIFQIWNCKSGPGFGEIANPQPGFQIANPIRAGYCWAVCHRWVIWSNWTQ